MKNVVRSSESSLGSSGQDPAYASKSEAVHNTVKTVNGSFQFGFILITWKTNDRKVNVLQIKPKSMRPPLMHLTLIGEPLGVRERIMVARSTLG